MKKVFFLFVLAVMAVSCSNNKLNAPDMPVSQDVVASSPNPVFVWYDVATKLAKMDFDEMKRFFVASGWDRWYFTDSTVFGKILDNGVKIEYHLSSYYPGYMYGSITSPDTALLVDDVRTAISKLGSTIVLNGYNVDYNPEWHYWHNGALLTEHPSFEENVSWIGDDTDDASSIEWRCQESPDNGSLRLIFHWDEINGKKYIHYISFSIDVPGREDFLLDSRPYTAEDFQN